MSRARLGLLGIYLAAFLTASYLDLWTTDQALRHAGVSEANVYSTSEGLYSAAKAWAITAAGGAVMASLFAFGLRNAALVSDASLEHPLRSFSKVYLNPWSRRFIDRSPLHAISFALAFVLLRLLAAGNNLVLMAGGVGPLGSAVRWTGRMTSPALGFVLTIGVVYFGACRASVADGRRTGEAYPNGRRVGQHEAGGLDLHSARAPRTGVSHACL